MKRTVVVPDLQVPYHDPVAVKNVAAYIKAVRPDSVVTLGDEIDLPQISRWTENTPGWYEQTLAADRDEAVEVLWSLVEHTKDAHMIRSNHTDRLYNVIMKKIPAFLALPELRFEKFMKLDELGITYHKKPYAVARGIVAVHGDEQSVKPTPGLTALEAARRHGISVICGHTHRAGQSAFTEASGGKIGRILRGWEGGHLMDVRQAHYTKGTMNWQQAFIVIEEIGTNVQVSIINLEKDGTFVVSGKRYGRAR
jgi:predicted phosphodiesterase